MSFLRRARKAVAVFAAAVVVAAGLTLAPGTAAPAEAASDSSNASTILKGVNKARTDNGRAAFLSNDFLTAYAKEYAAILATYGLYTDREPDTIPYLTGLTTSNLEEVYWRYSGATPSTSRIISDLRNETELLNAQLNYGTVSYVKRGSYTYVVALFVQYTATPPNILKTATPTITGTAAVGTTLTVKTSGWTSGTEFTYQWKANGANVGSDSTTYTLGVADLGKTITVQVVGSRSGFANKQTQASTTTLNSKATKSVATGTLITKTPTIAGKANVDQTLTATAGTWTSGTTLTYQWLRSGKAISGATATTYVLTATDKGKTIAVKVTGTQVGYKTASKTSKATATVASPLIPTTTVPTISGDLTVGEILTAEAGAWAPEPVTLKYQWYVGGKAVSKATKSTYTLAAADAGKTVKVKVTGSKTGYSAVALTSASTGAVAKATFGTLGEPVITGTTQVGKTLKVSVGTWSPKPSGYSYQWYRDETPISKATAASYTLTSKDKDKDITVEVTAKRAGYTSATVSSNTVFIGILP